MVQATERGSIEQQKNGSEGNSGPSLEKWTCTGGVRNPDALEDGQVLHKCATRTPVETKWESTPGLEKVPNGFSKRKHISLER